METRMESIKSRMVKQSMLLAALCMLSSIAASAWAGPALMVGGASGNPGTIVTIPITFDPLGASVAGIQFSLVLPAGLSTGTVTAGSAATNAGKNVSANLASGNSWNFVVFGLNQTGVAAGTLLTAQMTIAAGTPGGNLTLTPSNVVYSDGNGNPVAAGTSTGGTVTVNAPAPVLTSITLSPSAATIANNGTEQFTAIAKDQNGNTMSGITFTFASSNQSAATINSSGLATGANTTSGSLTTNITASASGVTSSAAVLTVNGVPAPTGNPSLAGGSVSGNAGSTVNLPISFNASGALVASIQFSIAIPAGMTPGTPAAGSAVTAAGKSASSNLSGSSFNVVVFGLNQTTIGSGSLVTIPLTIAANAAGGTSTLAISNVVFSDPNGNPVTAGTSASGSVSVTAAVPVLTSISISPSAATIADNGTQQFTATAKDQNGNTMSGITFTFASSNQSAATINSSGLATGANTTSGSLMSNITASASGITSPPAVLTVNGVQALPPPQTSGLPITFTGATTPETYSAIVPLTVPANATAATLHITCFDCDHTDFGSLVINGGAPMAMWVPVGVANATAILDVPVAVSALINGNNTFTFTRTGNYGGGPVTAISATFTVPTMPPPGGTAVVASVIPDASGSNIAITGNPIALQFAYYGNANYTAITSFVPGTTSFRHNFTWPATTSTDRWVCYQTMGSSDSTWTAQGCAQVPAASSTAPPPPTPSGPTLAGGSVSGAAGSTVNLPINFDPTGASVASIQFSIAIPAGMTAGSLAAGTTLNNAGKSVSSNMSGSNLNVVIFGLNQNTIAAGSLFSLPLTIAAGTPVGTSTLSISNAVYSDPNGVAIAAGSNTSGSVSVTATTTPPADTTPPTVSITAPSNNASVSGTVNVTANASDNVGVAGVQFQIDGNNLGAESTLSPYSASLNSTQFANGSHSLTAIARDAAGNKTTSAAVSININNTTPPSSGAPTLAGGTASGNAGTTVNLPINFDPARASVASIQFSIAIPAGMTAGSITAGTTLTNAGKSVSSNLSGSNLNIVIFGLNQNMIAAGSLFSIPLTIAAGMPAGTSKLAISNAVYSDPNGAAITAGANTSATVTVNGTTTPPPTSGTPGTVSNLSASNSTSNGVTLSFSQVDNGSGLPAKYEVRYTSDTYAWWWGNGLSVTQGTCANLIGTATSGTMTCTVLGLSPSTAYQFQLVAYSGTMNQNAVFGGLSNVAKATTAASSTTPPPPPTSSGPTLAGGNVSGNAGTTVNLPISFDPAGKSVASIQFSISIPAGMTAGSITAGTTLTNTGKSVSSNLSGNNLNVVIFGLNQNAIAAGNLLTVPLTIAGGTPAGTSTLAISNAIYSDPNGEAIAAGSNTSGSVSVNGASSAPADTTPPTVSISAPSNNATVTGTITISANASDNVGVAGVQLKLDGNNLGAELINSPYSASFNSLLYANGSHAITAVARDAAGNKTTSASVAISISNTTPVPTPTAPTLTGGSVAGNAGSTVNFPISFDPAGKSVASMQFALTIPSGLTAGTVTAGSILTTAGKSVSANLSGNTLTIVIFGLNQNTIPAGSLLTVPLTIAAGTPAGTLAISMSNAAYSDPMGNAIAAGSNISGSISVNGSGTTTAAPVVSAITANYSDVDTSTPGIQFYEGTTVSYAASATDPNGLPLTWAWSYSYNGGPQINFLSGSGAVQPAVFTYSIGSAGTSYLWMLTVSNGKSSAQQTYAVSIIAKPSTTPPVISGVMVSSITSSAAMISWMTDRPTDATVQFGTSTAYGNSISNSTLGTKHIANLTGLNANTFYHFHVTAKDASGNLAISTDMSFKTRRLRTKILVMTTPGGTIATSALGASSIDPADVTAAGKASNNTYLKGNLLVFQVLVDTNADTPLQSVRLQATDLNGSTFTIKNMIQLPNGLYMSYVDSRQLQGQGALQYFADITDSIGVADQTAVSSATISDIVTVGGSGSFQAPDGNPITGKTGVALPPSAGTIGQIVFKQLDASDPRLHMSGIGINTAYSQIPAAAFEVSVPGHDAMVFNQPLTMTLAYSDLSGPIDPNSGLPTGTGIVTTNSAPADTLKAFWFDGLQWRPLGGTVDIAKHTVTFETNHFSLYALFPASNALSAPASGSASDALAKEKFLSPTIVDGINDVATFGLSAQEVTIFDINGHRVFHATQDILGSAIIWNCRDDSGRIVNSGVYVAKVRSANGSIVYQTFAIAK